MTSKIIKKTLDEAANVQNAEIDFSDKAIVALEPDMSRLWAMKNITRLTLSHNKITEIPPAIASLENMEILNMFNTCLEDLDLSLTLRFLTCLTTTSVRTASQATSSSW